MTDEQAALVAANWVVIALVMFGFGIGMVVSALAVFLGYLVP